MNARRLVRIACACAVATLALVAPPSAHAHGLPPLPLALWGPFATPTVDCLRHLSQATRRCFNTTLSAHRHCIDAQLGGRTCDEAARDGTIAAARAAAVATVEADCRGGQLTELRFANITDAQNDLMKACVEADTALRMVYAPALNPIVAPRLSKRARECVTHVGAVASKILMATIHDQSRIFDAAAVHILAPSEKLARLTATNQRIASVRAQMAERLRDECAGTTVYDRGFDEILSLLGRRSGCVLSSVYFHTSVTCPAPVCGDGIVDTNEACDDGNDVNSDGCRSDCSIP